MPMKIIFWKSQNETFSYLGQKYDKKKSTGDETSTRKKDKLALVKDDLIQEKKIDIASNNPEKNNATSSNINKTSSLNELYAELVGRFHICRSFENLITALKNISLPPILEDGFLIQQPRFPC